ncbi:MraY family glycosyltransferase [Viridibacillus sp. NPDC096237]|uniref:MraY family glycosyltransferase n=1 Tax=Viridibacillus sp. NPDC096237 TaxID=3390721 RepID=UPI003D061196
MLYIALLTSIILSIILPTISKKFNLTQHTGGLAIFVSFIIGMFIVNEQIHYTNPIIISASLIVITSILVQNFKLSNIWTLFGQILAALIVILIGSVEISFINHIELGYLTIPFTLLFIVCFTNTTNIEKSPDGLITSLSIITLVSLSIIAFIQGDSFAATTGLLLIVSTLGFLLYSSISSKVDIGNTGTILLGFMIAIISLFLVKTSILAIYVPLFTLAVPIGLYYYFIKYNFTNKQSTLICCTVAILLSIPVFLLSTSVLWCVIIVLTMIIVISQFFHKYRFI